MGWKEKEKKDKYVLARAVLSVKPRDTIDRAEFGFESPGPDSRPVRLRPVSLTGGKENEGGRRSEWKKKGRMLKRNASCSFVADMST